MNGQKVVLLCRSATKEQLAFQQQRLTQYAEENGCEIVAIVGECKSGTSIRRFKLTMAIRLAHRNQAHILTTDISRVSRLHSVAVKYAKQLCRRAIQLFTMDEGIGKNQVENILTYANLGYIPFKSSHKEK